MSEPTPTENTFVEPLYSRVAPFAGLAVVPSCSITLEVAPFKAVLTFIVAPLVLSDPDRLHQ